MDLKKQNILLKWLLLFFILISIFMTINSLIQEKQIKQDKIQFHNIELCLKDEDVTKELLGAFINENGKVECHYGVGNGIFNRKVLEEQN